MYQWVTIMAGGPQDGDRIVRAFDKPRMNPPALRAVDGEVCCPVATHTGVQGGCCVVVHPDATPGQIERAVDAMLADPL
ncbi:hypothetical protein KR767_15300 [Luteibacter anthropi]|uniref:Uncharacterized protein n=1 Tax=Luteibacter anthropi TaxID=564369 RepID=A0A7X5UAN9_9GAMM|nr:hypothetical protein [Luteibacter anthropi]NII06974.1 hypothetical protein [Luteibacter anthropi]URX61424.1 hypothetical protein KR767_15300 [Luteibacter anthropi]